MEGTTAAETISFLETLVFPQLAQQIRSNSSSGTVESGDERQILPHKLPLKRRLAEFRYNSSSISRRGTTTSSGASPAQSTSSSPAFTNNLWAIERFRDITPAFVVAIFDDSLVLEPGDVGPLPFSHPVAQHLIGCINEQRISAGLLTTLRELGAPFYDGSIVLGIVDYRRWAFGGVKPSAPSTTGTAEPANTTVSATAGGVITPEMHKILLKTPYELISDDLLNVLNADVDKLFTNKGTSMMKKFDYPEEFSLLESTMEMGRLRQLLEIEAQVLLATSDPLCLDPSPMVSRVLTAINYDINKFRAHMRPPTFAAKTGEKGRETAEIKSARVEGFLHAAGLAPRVHQQRFHLLATVEEHRQSSVALQEPMYGLDARKDPSRLRLSAPPTLSWLAPLDSLWRTMRFEQRSDQRPIYFTVHTVITSQSSSLASSAAAGMATGTARGVVSAPGAALRFVAIIRIGTQPCTADILERRVLFPNKAAAEAFVDQFKQVMTVEGKTCVADVSNPNAISSLIRSASNTSGVGGGGEMIMQSGSYLQVPSQAQAGSSNIFIPSVVRPMSRQGATVGQSPIGGVGSQSFAPIKQTIMFGGPGIVDGGSPSSAHAVKSMQGGVPSTQQQQKQHTAVDPNMVRPQLTRPPLERKLPPPTAAPSQLGKKQ